MSEYAPSINRLVSYSVFYFLVTSGLRASEMCALNCKNVEIVTENGVDRYYVNFLAKGGVVTRHEIYGPALAVIGIVHQTFFRKFDLNSDRPLLLNREGQRFKYNSLYKRIVRIGEEAKRKGIIRKNIDFSCHTLRRTYITLLFKKGMNVKSVQKLSRHKSIEVLFKHYIDISEPPTPYLDDIFDGKGNDEKGDDTGTEKGAVGEEDHRDTEEGPPQ